MAGRNLKARYKTVGPTKAMVTFDKCWIDDETKSLQKETVTEEMDTYMVYFPLGKGHSIRVTGYYTLRKGKVVFVNAHDKLIELGFHIKPRIVDMDTGDVVDVGGDPYDFTGDVEDVILDEDIDNMGGRKTKAA